MVQVRVRRTVYLSGKYDEGQGDRPHGIGLIIINEPGSTEFAGGYATRLAWPISDSLQSSAAEPTSVQHLLVTAVHSDEHLFLALLAASHSRRVHGNTVFLSHVAVTTHGLHSSRIDAIPIDALTDDGAF